MKRGGGGGGFDSCCYETSTCVLVLNALHTSGKF